LVNSSRATDVSNWKRMEVALEAKATNHNSRLELKTNKRGVIWFDQVSLMPMDTYEVCFPQSQLIFLMG